MNTNTKSYIAACDIPRNSLVKFAGTHEQITLATAGTDLVIGVTTEKDVKTGQMADVKHLGTGEVRYGGIVARGESFTAGANGKAFKAEAGNIIAGYALRDSAIDDIALSVIQRG